MAVFNPNKMKIGKPVKKPFEGGEVYIRTGLSASQGICLHQAIKVLDDEAVDFSMQYALVVIKVRVVNAKDQPLFTDTVDEMIKQYEAGMIDRLYELVTGVIDGLSKTSDAAKNS